MSRKARPAAVNMPAVALTVYEKLTMNAYLSKLPLPKRPSCSDPRMIAYDKAEHDAYIEASVAYRADNGRLHDELRADTEAYYGTDKLPLAVRGMAWNFAWEHGHSGGMSEVVGAYCDYAELALLAHAEGLKAAGPLSLNTPPSTAV